MTRLSVRGNCKIPAVIGLIAADRSLSFQDTIMALLRSQLQTRICVASDEHSIEQVLLAALPFDSEML